MNNIEFIDKQIRYLGVSGISIALNNILLLIDPHLNLDKSFIKTLSPNIKELHIFLSHGHYDHYEFIPQIIDNLNKDFTIKIFLPLDIYNRDKIKLSQKNVSIYSFSDYLDGMQSSEYSVIAYKGSHAKQSLLYILSLFLKKANYPEIRKHSSLPAKDMVNYIFKIKSTGISIGHIGSACLNNDTKKYFKDLGILLLAVAPKMKTNIEHINTLSPKVCIPIHHLNSQSGVMLVKDIDVGVLKNKFKNVFLEKEIYNSN